MYTPRLPLACRSKDATVMLLSLLLAENVFRGLVGMWKAGMDVSDARGAFWSLSPKRHSLRQQTLSRTAPGGCCAGDGARRRRRICSRSPSTVRRDGLQTSGRPGNAEMELGATSRLPGVQDEERCSDG